MSDAPILMVWPEYPPRTGGMQVHGVEFARFLHRRGIPFVLITRKPASPEEAAESREVDAINGFSPLRVLRDDDFHSTTSILRDWVECLKPRAVFSSQLALSSTLAAAGRVICRSAGNDALRPWVGPYDVRYKTLRRVALEEQRRRIDVNRLWLRKAAAHCDEVICNSRWTADRLQELGLRRLRVVSGGVNTELFCPLDREEVRGQIGWPTSSPVAIVAARHVLKKGIDHAIEATSLLRDMDLRLMVAGQGPETANLKSLAYDLDIADRVHFLGTIPHALLPRYFAAADVLLFPSRSIYDPRRFAIDHETMGRTLCEAAACGTPAIASESAGIPSVVRDGETALLVPPNNPQELAAATRRVLQDQDLWDHLSRTARSYALEMLDFETVNSATLRIIEGKCDE